MNSRERVCAALSHKPVDRVPRDLGGMNSTGVSAFAYPGLVKALGLPPRRPRIHDTIQMLALPDRDVLDALGCDVVHVSMDWYTNAFDEPERWHPYGFNGRLAALVMNPSAFEVKPDGTIVQSGGSSMPPASYVFDAPHGGEALDLSKALEPPDPKWWREHLAKQALTDERIRSVREYCRRAREATDRAIMFNGLQCPLGFPGGIASWSMQCMAYPDAVAEVHAVMAEHMAAQYRALLPEIAQYVDVVMMAADDQGTQNGPILPPEVYGTLYAPAYRRITDAAHAAAPNVKLFLHCCGAIYDLLEHVIAGGFDVLNPVQWSAGCHGYREWKDRCRGRIALWGGGVNSQVTLPLGTVEQVESEVRDVVAYLGKDSGYVFCAIHNLLAEIAPEKIVALYRAAKG